LEPALPGLPKGPVRLVTLFKGNIEALEARDEHHLLNYDEAKATVNSDIDMGTSTVFITVSAEFEKAVFHHENIAERALVAALVKGFAKLAHRVVSSDEIEDLVGLIVPNANARQTHAFVARTFRDFVKHSVRSAPVKIDRDDMALLKLGLGWRARDRAAGPMIEGKEGCISFLNAVVRLLEEEICVELSRYNRRSVINLALQNHESAANDRDNWVRTAAAISDCILIGRRRSGR
jgi:hypothetical protein